MGAGKMTVSKAGRKQRPSPWTVYIVQCSDGTLYTGVTTDLSRRLREHNGQGSRGARFTAARRPVMPVYHERANNRSAAGKREAAIKKLNRRQKLELISSIS
jgi:putative endonuclease